MVGHSNESKTLKSEVVVEEQFLAAMTGKPEDCEDVIHIGSHFIAVIDGATSKTTRRWDGETGGRVGAYLLSDLLERIPAGVAARQAADLMTATIQEFYVRHGVVDVVTSDPVQRLTASIVVVSLQKRELWFIGDCQCLLDQKLIYPRKDVDTIASEARAMFLASEILNGKTIEELSRDDTGRSFILPLLERQPLFQNNPAAVAYWYPAVDGFPIPEEGILVQAIPDDAETIVLASDGYPILENTLQASEEALREVLHHDPLLFQKYKSTKGLRAGNSSYDDRAYVKLRMKDRAHTEHA